MSRRTAEADKAIRLAWQREHELIKQGKGTRDWTDEQQKDILDPEKGRAYDDSGRAFNGQHMKSVEKYPEYQGNPDNIQFLTRDEHLEAHKGNWQNPTNWYYEPTTKQFFDFSETELIPCEPIKLSNPIIELSDDYNKDATEDLTEHPKRKMNSDADPPIENSYQINTMSSSVKKDDIGQLEKTTAIAKIKSIVNVAKNFTHKHPVLTWGVTAGIGLTLTATVGKVIKTKTNPSIRVYHSLSDAPSVNPIKENVANIVSKFDFKNTVSMLKQLGYSVDKKNDILPSHRHEILQKAIKTGMMTKNEVCAFLVNNINLHKNQSSFAESVSKWNLDLFFVKNDL